MRGARVLMSLSEDKQDAISKIDYEIREVIQNLNFVNSSKEIIDLEGRLEQLNEDFVGLRKLRDAVISM